MFWTLSGGPSGRPITLCESCALLATNAAFYVVGAQQVATMEEAAVLLDLSAIIGSTKSTLSSSPFGHCESQEMCQTPDREEVA